MKATQLSVKMMIDELNALERSIDEARDACRDWLAIQEDRENGYGYDPDYAYSKRVKMERTLTEFREQMSSVYDFQGDKGLTNFVPTGSYESDEDVA